MNTRYEKVEEKSEKKPRFELVEDSNLNKANKVAEGFNNFIESSRLPAMAGGFLQGTGQTAASIANVPLQLLGKSVGKDLRIPHPDLGQYLPNDVMTNIAFGAGELGSVGGAGLKAANLINKAGLSKIPGISGAIARPVEGAAVGAVLGEDKEGNRGLGAALGAAGNAVVSAGKYAKSLLPEGMAKRILTGAKEEKEKYKELYGNFFKNAEKEGLGASGITIPEINMKFISKSPTKYHQSVKDFFEKPSLETAHWAQSDLGKLARKLENQYERSGLTSSELKTLKAAQEGRSKIQNSMKQTLESSGDASHSKAYEELGHGYLNDVIPYEVTKEGKAAKKFMKDLESSEVMAKKHPELAHGKMLKSLLKHIPAKYLIGGSLFGLGAAGGFKAFKTAQDE